MPETPDDRRWIRELSADYPLLTIGAYRTPTGAVWAAIVTDDIEAKINGRPATLLARYRGGKPLD
jgi:hypothetical protein